MIEFSVDALSSGKPFLHYWEECVGSGHASLALRADYQSQLKQCHDALGFRFVRFHGILCDDMSTCSGTKEMPYSFYNVDQIIDYLLSIGMKPLIELSFMPEKLASGDKTIFHYKGNITPPTDYDEWGRLIGALTSHLVDRYGLPEVASWFFEVWNEPNLIYFWSGTKEEYFKLYNYAARAVKAVDSSLRVGGPATAANAWVDELIEYCKAEDVPLDFVSTHHYPTDVALGHYQDMEQCMADTKRGTVTEMAKSVRAQAGDMPLFYTEWHNSPSCRDRYHDDPYAAAFVIKSIADNDGIVDMYSFWTFSDIFEELYFASAPFHGGFGMLNIHGIKKPVYNAFYILHRLGNERLNVTSSDPDATVECLAVNGDKELGIILYNHDVPLSGIQTHTVKLDVKGISDNAVVRLVRIDDTHLNPKAEWIKLGEPEYLTKEQITHLKDFGELQFTETVINDGQLELTIPPQGIIALFIER